MLRLKFSLPLMLLVAGYLVYAGIYIFRTSFVIAEDPSVSTRYFVLFDDAMISMRFADNLAQGFGPVWNPGERVEGYTNPLWVVFMAFFHLLPVPAAKISLLIQISGALFLAANIGVTYKLAERFSGSRLAAWLAAALTAFYMPLNNWGLQGMEVSLLVLVVSLAAWIVMKGLDPPREYTVNTSSQFVPWLYLLLGAATLVRTDMAVPFLVIFSFLLVFDKPRRRHHLAWGGGMLVLFMAGQTLFRVWYYGDPLPNTYYLKMVGYPLVMRVARGAYVLFDFVTTFNWILFCLPLAGLFFRMDRAIFVLGLLIAGQAAYSVYVGGDAWEHKGGANRYLSVAMPLFFVLFTYTVERLFHTLSSAWLPLKAPVHLGLKPRRIDQMAALGTTVFVLAAMLNMNLIASDVKSLERWLLLRQPIFVEGNKEYVQIALDIRQLTKPDARIAVVTAGSIPYFSERYAIDLLGKCDPYIARLKARNVGGLRNLENFRPGHMKWDYDYSIGQLQPDMVVQMWEGSEAARPYLERDYVIGGTGSGLTYNLRKGSNAILWEQVQK